MNTGKRVLFFFAITLLCIAQLTFVSAFSGDMGFYDVPDDAWYRSDASIFWEKGLMPGPSGTPAEPYFEPNKEVTYAEIIQVAAILYEEHMFGTYELLHVVSDDLWYSPYVNYASMYDLLPSISVDFDIMRDIEKPATRGMAMEILARSMPEALMPEVNQVAYDTIPDVPMSHEMAHGIYKMFRVGIAGGIDTDHNFYPEDVLTRDFLAAYVSRLIIDARRLNFTMTPDGGFSGTLEPIIDADAYQPPEEPEPDPDPGIPEEPDPEEPLPDPSESEDNSPNIPDIIVQTPADIPSVLSEDYIQSFILNSDYDLELLLGKRGSEDAEIPESETMCQIKSNPGKETSPTLIDITNPMFYRLGYGYDIFGEYAEASALTYPVLDIGKLISDKCVSGLSVDYFDTVTNISESLKKYVEKMSVNAGISGHYFCFSGSVDTRFDEIQTSTTNNYFATIELLLQKFRTFIYPETNYKDYLRPAVRAKLNDVNVDPREILDTYGAFVLVDFITEGKIIYVATQSSVSASSFRNFELDVKAGFNAGVSSLQTEFGYSQTNASDSYTNSANAHFTSAGGTKVLSDTSLKNDQDAVQAWADSLETRGTLVGFTPKLKSLIPIWETSSTF